MSVQFVGYVYKEHDHGRTRSSLSCMSPRQQSRIWTTHVARSSQQSLTWTNRLYSRAPVIWSTRPQRGAGRTKRYRPQGVSCGPLDQDTWQAERRNLRVHSVWNGGCSNHARYDGGCKATSSRERATSNRWSISRSGTRAATRQGH